MADVNSDGLLDIYVCKSGNYPSFQRANQLYINHSSGGKIRFIESAKAYGLADTTLSNQAAFFDFDKDNDLDLFLITSTNSTRNPNALVAPLRTEVDYLPINFFKIMAMVLLQIFLEKQEFYTMA